MAKAFLSKVTSRSKDSAQQWQPPEELAPVALPGQDKLSGGQGPQVLPTFQCYLM